MGEREVDAAPALQDTVSGSDRTVTPKGRVSRGKRVETQWEQKGKRGVGDSCCISPCLQLFRRVASALPGMENVQEKSKEGSILFP